MTVFHAADTIPIIALAIFIVLLLCLIFGTVYFTALWYRHRCLKCADTESRFHGLEAGTRPVITKYRIKARQLVLRAEAQAQAGPAPKAGPGLPAGLNPGDFEDIELGDLEAQALPHPRGPWRKVRAFVREHIGGST